MLQAPTSIRSVMRQGINLVPDVLHLWGVDIPVPKVLRVLRWLIDLADHFDVTVQPGGHVLVRHSSGSLVQFDPSGDVRVWAARDLDYKTKRFLLLNSNAKRIPAVYRRNLK